MRKPGYYEAIRWCALNDEATERDPEVVFGMITTGNGPPSLGVKMPMFRLSLSSGPNVSCTNRYFALPPSTLCSRTTFPFTFPGAGGAVPTA